MANQLIEKRAFTGGMDGDTNARELPPNTMLNLMNASVGVSEYGRTLRIENRPGTTQISQSVYPPYGTNICLGSCIDYARNNILFAIYNSVGYHGIYCRDIDAGITYAVLYDSQVTGGLDWSKTNRLDRNMKVVGDMLYWVDPIPRRINYIAGIKMNHPSFVTDVAPYDWPMNQSVIDWIRRPYGLPVLATKGTVGSIENFVDTFSGQFASAFVYRDGEPTVASVPCAMVNFNIEGETYDWIQITFPLIEDFDQDVQIIQLLVRYGNSPDYFIIKEWNRANATDLAAINAHNNGITNLTYNFYNNQNGIAFGKSESVKPFDNIGTSVKTIEYADNKFFLANYTKGYDTPTTSSLTGSVVSGSGATGYTRIWKVYSTYQLAIQFRDRAKRKCFVVTNPSMIVTIPDRDLVFNSYTTGINWVVSNAAATTEIPDWAEYYDILITKNLRTRNFIGFQADPMQYAKKQPDGTFTYQNTYDSNVYGVALKTFLMNNSGIGYLFTEGSGDVVQLYLSTTATVYSLNVIAQDAEYIIVQPENLGNTVSSIGARVELYTPYNKSENESFYTTGESFLISNPGTPSRTYSTTSGIISGDVYRYFNSKVEFMSPNNKVKWDVWTNIYGEENKQSLLGQVEKDEFVSWSNTKIIGAQVNGLSTFDALAEKAIPGIGAINKLQLASKVSDMGQGDIMLAVGSTETASLYLGEVSVQASSQEAYIARTSEIIGSANVLKGGFGTQNPESVIEYLGLVFGFDADNGVVWQYSPAGLEPVSRYNMSRFFSRYAKDYIAASTGNLDNINGFHHIPFGIDPFYKELVCGMPGLIYDNYATTLPSYSVVPSYATSIINRFDIYDQLQKDMLFKFEENKWGSNFKYGAEWYEYSENKMFAWKNGVMYEHNTDTVNWNTFYGVQQPIRLCFTGNLNPSALKILNNIVSESNAIPNFTVAYTDWPNIQITDLASTDTDTDGNPVWVDTGGLYDATFFKDRLSPNVSGTADEKLYTGDDLTDFAIKVMMEFQAYTELVFINYVNLGYSLSKGNKQILNPINK